MEHGTDIDEETAALMREHDVALVPTFAVIEQLTDTESMDLDPAARDRAAGSVSAWPERSRSLAQQA